jgi:hypothetical protein
VLVLRPFIACIGAAPRLHHVAVAVKLNHWRRGRTALRARRTKLCSFLILSEGARALDDPNILRVDGDAGDLAKEPVVRQRLWPERIDFELRRLTGRGAAADEQDGY